MNEKPVNSSESVHSSLGIDVVTVALLGSRNCDLINCISYYIVDSPLHKEKMEKVIFKILIELTFSFLYKIICNINTS